MASINYETSICGRMLSVDEVARALGMSPENDSQLDGAWEIALLQNRTVHAHL